ncbi:MAG: hypothetical protein J6Y48_00460 [Clostridia bacterium]|nr:hypothetical protein [Clostridia bacterium]
MDEKRKMQSTLNHSLSGLKENPFLAQRVIEQAKGEPEMKKKISFAFILAMVLLLVLAAAAIAEVLGINVFEVFGKTNARYAELAPYTTVENTPEVSVNSVELGQTSAAINSAYYDGTSLIVGYAIRHGSYMEEYIPDETLTAEMTPMDNNLVWMANNDEEGELIAAWMQARDEGRKAGLVRYSVGPSDHTETDDGIDIKPRTEETRPGEDGVEYTMREYEAPLTEELQNLDQITVNIRLYRSEDYLYFDGENTWTLQKTEPAGTMRAVVQKAGAQSTVYRGTGSYQGRKLNASAAASASYAALDIRFDGPLPQLPEDHWYSFHLTDETGTMLFENECWDDSAKEGTLTYEGTGKVPQKLILRILEEQEGDFDVNAALDEAEAIILSGQ